jgi:hypothetical protein
MNVNKSSASGARARERVERNLPQRSAVQCSAVQRRAVQRRAAPCRTASCSAVHRRAHPHRPRRRRHWSRLPSEAEAHALARRTSVRKEVVGHGARVPPPPATRLQHAMFSAINALDADSLRGDSTNAARRLDASRGVGGTAFLTATPSSAITTLSDAELRIAVRLRLGLPLFNDLPSHCPHCENRPLSAATSHPISCRSVMHYGGEASLRHDGLHGVFVRHLLAAGMSVQVEVRPPRESWDQHRPDLHVQDGELSRFVTDHAVVDPCAPSYNRPTREIGTALSRPTFVVLLYGDG